MTPFACCDERRRVIVRDLAPVLGQPEPPNGIDFVEVVDHDFALYGLLESDRQRVLHVWFLRPPVAPLVPPGPPGTAVDPASFAIDGGTRIRNLQVVAASFVNIDGEQVLRLFVNEPGDFSTYTLRLVDPSDPKHLRPHPALDPLLARLDLRFKIECPSGLDCADGAACAPAPRPGPVIDYLAKDFASFRRLMLDRLALLLPGPIEQNPADLGITLVELLAYVADQWSYRQDAIATEAYLGTAHHRISVRRHALLLDYRMHEGMNARAWVRLLVAPGAALTLPFATRLYTRVADVAPRVSQGPGEQPLRDAGATCFETMHAAALFAEHDELRFHTWGARECFLPRGATRATLLGKLPNLAPGDVLIFEEVLGPRSGNPADADPAHRHAVRLTEVTPATDLLAGRSASPPTSAPAEVTEIVWHEGDALPFPLCISTITDIHHGAVFIQNVSLARGNIVLADHGGTVTGEPLPPVPAPDPRLAPVRPHAACAPSAEPVAVPLHFHPVLALAPVTRAAPSPIRPARRSSPLTQAAPLSASAASFFRRRVEDALPAAWLDERAPSGSGPVLRTWSPRHDLLSSDGLATDLVIETDDAGSGVLRFGDDEHGAVPAAGAALAATYRAGNGRGGNVGAEALRHVVSPDPNLLGALNPMAAQGGEDPEPIEHVRQNAPYAFRRQERAVTPADYAEVAERHDEVQRAVATLRYTGSFYAVFLAVDRVGGKPVDAAFAAELTAHMERYRLANHDLLVVQPRFVAITLGLAVCVAPGYFRSDVRRALLAVLGNGLQPSGAPGLFHPDRFSFGQPVILSTIVAAAQAVTGVAAVTVTALQRLGEPASDARADGVLPLGASEIARLDNDPSLPENGRLELQITGGR